MHFGQRFSDGRQISDKKMRGTVRWQPAGAIQADGALVIHDLLASGPPVELGRWSRPTARLTFVVLSRSASTEVVGLFAGDPSLAVSWRDEGWQPQPDDLATFAIASSSVADQLPDVGQRVAGDPPRMRDPIHRSILDGRALAVWLEHDARWRLHRGFDRSGDLCCLGFDLGILWAAEPVRGRVPIDPFAEGPVAAPLLHEANITASVRTSAIPGHLIEVDVYDPKALTLRFVGPQGVPLRGTQSTSELDGGWRVRLESPVLLASDVYLDLELSPVERPV